MNGVKSGWAWLLQWRESNRLRNLWPLVASATLEAAAGVAVAMLLPAEYSQPAASVALTAVGLGLGIGYVRAGRSPRLFQAVETHCWSVVAAGVMSAGLTFVSMVVVLRWRAGLRPPAEILQAASRFTVLLGLGCLPTAATAVLPMLTNGPIARSERLFMFAVSAAFLAFTASRIAKFPREELVGVLTESAILIYATLPVITTFWMNWYGKRCAQGVYHRLLTYHRRVAPMHNLDEGVDDDDAGERLVPGAFVAIADDGSRFSIRADEF
jgi:hypothetical protein